MCAKPTRIEKIAQSDVVRSPATAGVYLIMDTIYSPSREIIGFHGLPISKAGPTHDNLSSGYHLTSSRLMEEMGLPYRKHGYVIDYNFEVLPQNIIKQGQLHDTRKETKIENGYNAVLTRMQLGIEGLDGAPSFRTNKFHECFPPQEDKDIVRPYVRRTQEEIEAEKRKPRKIDKSVTRDLPLKEAFDRGVLNYVASPNVLMGAMSPDAPDYAGLEQARPIVGKDGNAVTGQDGKPIVITTLKEAYDFVTQGNFVDFAAKNLLFVGKKTAENIKEDVISGFHQLNEHKFK